MRINDGIKYLVQFLKEEQWKDGSWRFPFETGISTDCYMIILLRSLEINDEKLIHKLAERILSKQEKDGTWKLYHDEEGGNVTATLEAYYALLYSGLVKKEQLRKAKSFILRSGGLEKVHMFTKFMLAMTGQQKWPKYFPIPLEFILLPPNSPIHFYQMSVYGRANLLPLMILAERKFQLRTEQSPDLTEFAGREEAIFPEEWRSLHTFLKKAAIFPHHLKRKAEEKAKQYMLARIEPDGTFYSYFSSTFLMIFALMALGYPKTHPVIRKAVKGLISFGTEINGCLHIQYTTSTVWNTALINYALQEAGCSLDDPVVKKGNEYLLNRQHHLFGDWVLQSPRTSPGGWGFSHINTINPDVDDTTASLRSIFRAAGKNPLFHDAWVRGIRWLLSMQNKDGGWPAFEKNKDCYWLNWFPIENGEYILADPASADLTGRTLEFLASYTKLPSEHPSIKRAVRSILNKQERDGSWRGRWGICYIYGTWGAITGLCAAGIVPSHPSISKGISWLKRIQNEDGGWGESCKSDQKNKYIPLGTSTLTDTALALDALIAVEKKPTKEIRRGIKFLLGHLQGNGWTYDYPKGQGMAGAFYIHYHSYRYVFPLLALAHYKRKYITGKDLKEEENSFAE